jgi:hypothetical protein
MERIGREVERAFARAGGGAGQSLAQITSVWPRVVGDAISRNAWPLRLGRDGTLHVATSSATWAFELELMAQEIVERLAGALGESAPTSLKFRAGPLPEPAPERQPARPARPPEASPETAAAAAEAAAAVEDPELRELVARAARASLSRGPSGRRF